MKGKERDKGLVKRKKRRGGRKYESEKKKE
jgi:hypothetical protein